MQCVVLSTSCSVLSVLPVWYTLLRLAGGELLPRRLSRFPALRRIDLWPGNAFLLCVRIYYMLCVCVSTTCCVGAVTYSDVCSQGCYVLLYVRVLTPVYGRAAVQSRVQLLLFLNVHCAGAFLGKRFRSKCVAWRKVPWHEAPL